MTDRDKAIKVAEAFHNAAYEAEKNESLYPYRDFITFYGMPSEYQGIIIRAVESLLDQGVIKYGDSL